MIGKFKKILEHEGITGRYMSETLGLTYGSYKNALINGSTTPKWVISFIIAYELNKINEIEVKDEEIL